MGRSEGAGPTPGCGRGAERDSCVVRPFVTSQRNGGADQAVSQGKKLGGSDPTESFMATTPTSVHQLLPRAESVAAIV